MGVLKAILIIFLIIILLVGAAGAYLYYFHVFKTFRVCVSNDVQDTPIPCETDEQCLNTVLDNLPQLKKTIGIAPPFIQRKISEVTEEVAYCESTCKLRIIYGDLTGQQVDSCEPGDKEIKVEIRGKEGLEILDFVRKNPELADLI